MYSPLVVSMLFTINEVALQWTGLLLGWVTLCKVLNHLGM